MSDSFIEPPIETEPDALAADGFDYIQSKFPGWVPNDANLDTILVEAVAFITAEARDVASAVPTDIFRSFGKLVDILPEEASPAQATTAWTVIDDEGYTVPVGTQIGIKISGDEMIAFETVEAIEFINGGATTITGVDIQAAIPGSDGTGLPDDSEVVLLDALDYVTGIDLEVDTFGGRDAESDDVYLNRLSARLQVMSQHPVLPEHFAIYAQDIDGVERATAIDTYNPHHNRLTANQSSLETDTTGWIADTNCSIARVNTQAADGLWSLRLRSTAGGDMDAVTTPNNMFATGGGAQVTAMAVFKAAASGRSCRVRLDWYDSGPSFISSSNGANITDNGIVFTQAFVTAIAPVNAAFVRVGVEVLGTGGAAEDHFVDKIALRNTPSLTWTIGGTPDIGNERYVTVAGVDSEGQELSDIKDNEIDLYLESLREINFVVEVIKPVYTAIDVTFTAIAKAGFDTNVVEAAAEQAVEDYLDPKNWGLPEVADFEVIGGARQMWINKEKVRYLEVASVINAVPGIDYIATLQTRIAGGSFGTTDITFGNPVPMPTPGTITGTVTPP